MSGFKKPLISDTILVRSPFYIKYGIPILLTIIATLIKIWLNNYIGYKSPFLLYCGVVIITSRYFGEKAAVMVTILSAIAVDVFFIHPFNSIFINEDSILQVILFILECVLIISLSSALTKAVNIINENDIRFKTLVEKSSEGIVTMNVHGKIEYCSPSIHNIIGYTDEEFLNLPSWDLLLEEEALEIKEQFFRFASHPGKTITLMHQMKHKNGNWIWIESRMTNLLGEPPINAVIANFTDITERIINEKIREDFIGIASHELKTPLTSLKAYTQVLQSRFKNGTDETSLSIVNKIEHQVARVIQMVTNLLDVTSLHEKRLNLNIKELDLNLLVSEIIDSIQQSTKKHQIIAELAPIQTILGDRERLGQVITNMLSNAIKYSPNADTVHVITKLENGQVILSVSDEGIGIPKKDLNKVFGRFYRVDESKNLFQGLGLGLFICSQIVEQHDGKIGVQSEEGKGSTFWFSLPLGS
jgi:PAS domain S-box-containing protein